MKVFKFIVNKILFPASFFFTIFNIFAYVIEYADTDNSSKLKSFSLVLVYFIIVAFANNIFKTEISTAAKIGIHYAAIILPLVCGIMLMGNDNAVGGVFMVITIIYAVVATPVLIIHSLIRRKDNDSEKYDSQFNKIK